MKDSAMVAKIAAQKDVLVMLRMAWRAMDATLERTYLTHAIEELELRIQRWRRSCGSVQSTAWRRSREVIRRQAAARAAAARQRPGDEGPRGLASAVGARRSGWRRFWRLPSV